MDPDLDRLDAPSRPPIALRRSDAERLYAVAMTALLKDPRCAGGLLDLLHRAAVIADDQAAADIAGIGSDVDFIDHQVSPDCVHRARLVLPEDAAGDEKLSVLSDVGAALLGLAPAQSIIWPDRRGGTVRLTMVAVQPPGPPWNL